jgi:hypothetical protein
MTEQRSAAGGTVTSKRASKLTADSGIPHVDCQQKVHCHIVRSLAVAAGLFYDLFGVCLGEVALTTEVVRVIRCAGSDAGAILKYLSEFVM